MNKQELKPCPFCSKDVVIRTNHKSGMSPTYSILHKEMATECIMISEGHYTSETLLIEAWNTRSAPIISDGAMLTEIRRHHEVRNFKVPPGFDIGFRECFKWLINR